MFQRTSYFLVFIGFFILSGIGCYFGNDENTSWTQWILEKGRWMLVLANLAFLFLAMRQLAVWNVSTTADGILLKRLMGWKKGILRKQDFTSFKIQINRDPWWMKHPRTTFVLELQTTRGKWTFNSSDYNSFEQTVSTLFAYNAEMRLECLRQISRLKM